MANDMANDTANDMANAAPSSVKERVVHIADLPCEENFLLLDSSFFKKNARKLPSPAEIWEKNAIKGVRPKDPRPPTVAFEEQVLIVKYGSDITIAETQCLWYFNSHMKGQIPTPELFGWLRDGDETFIYMELIPGDTLKDAWR